MEKFRPIWIVVAAIVLSGVLIWAKPWQSQKPETDIDGTAPISLTPAEDRSVTLAGFRTIEDRDNVVRLSGYAEPNIPVELTDSEGRLVSFTSDEDGEWDAVLSRGGTENLQIALRTVVSPNKKIVTDQSAIRIVASPAEIIPDEIAGVIEPRLPAGQSVLLAVTQPGNASRVLRAPFDPPQSGPMTLVSIDYDNGGWAIITGRSSEAGFVRALVGGVDVGSTGTADNGSWSILTDRGLPKGELSLTLEFLNEASTSSLLHVMFDRRDTQVSDEGIEVQQTPEIWTVTRNLSAGGVQHLCVFSPLAMRVIPEG